jgi:hypothetical protein
MTCLRSAADNEGCDGGGLRNRDRPEAALAAATLAGVLIALDSGLMALVGWLLAGALIAAWTCVYARTMCGGRPLDWPILLRIAGWGALIMPILAATAWVAGGTVWLLVAGAAALWVALVTPQGQLPAPLQQWLSAARLSLRHLGDR